jgi:hypothetical protein
MKTSARAGMESTANFGHASKTTSTGRVPVQLEMEKAFSQ